MIELRCAIQVWSLRCKYDYLKSKVDKDVSTGTIIFNFLKEIQRKILRLNKNPPLFKEKFLIRKGGFIIKQYKVVKDKADI